ncbi:MAG: DUF4340 domain-containing protein, partial [Verrucomicrobiales bacterium]
RHQAGDTPFASLPLQELRQLDLQQGEKILEITRRDDRWTVAQKQHFPADVQSLARRLGELRELKVARPFAAPDKFADRFGLAADSDPAPITLRLKGPDNTELQSLTLGKISRDTRGRPRGRFVRLGDENGAVYLLNHDFGDFELEAADWLGSDFIKPAATLSLRSHGDEPNAPEEWTLRRERPDEDLTLASLAESEETKSEVASPLAQLFTNGGFDEALTSAEAEKVVDTNAPLRRFTLSDAEGFQYEFTLQAAAKEEENASESHLLTYRVSAEPGEPEKPADDAGEEARQAYEKALADYREKVERLRDEQARQEYSYRLPAYRVSPLLKSRSDFIREKALPEKSEEAPTPESADENALPASPAGESPRD